MEWEGTVYTTTKASAGFYSVSFVENHPTPFLVKNSNVDILLKHHTLIAASGEQLVFRTGFTGFETFPFPSCFKTRETGRIVSERSVGRFCREAPFLLKEQRRRQM